MCHTKKEYAVKTNVKFTRRRLTSTYLYRNNYYIIALSKGYITRFLDYYVACGYCFHQFIFSE